MAEEKVKKREWVKNAAIIFLSVMLVLTFFSNTFMNYSLPEVSTKYVESGSINAKIRGSGTVTAAQSYEVTYDQARKVETICVKVGQTVAAGDVLFILEEGDSDELEELKDQLEQAEFDYELALLKAGADKYVSESRAVSDAREDLSEARANANKIKNAESVIKAAEADLANKQARYDELYKHLKELESASGDTEEIKKLKELLAEAEDKAEAAKKYYDSLADTDPGKEEARKTWEAWEAAKADYQNKLSNLLSGTTSSGSGSGEEEGGTVIPPVQHDNEKYEELYNQLVAAGAEVTAAEVYLNSVQEKYGNISSGSYEAALDEVERAERAYDAAREALQNAIADGEIDEKTEEFNLKKMQSSIQKIKGKINELSTDNSNEITANTGGVVSEINVAPGGMTGMGSPLAVIELADRGYTLSMTVTAEQAKKVSVGDTAEVENYYWWGDEITAVLESIKNEPQSGGKNKVLTFTVSGGVEPGTNLNLSLGQKSARYDALVPNSAVRNDANGSFVLVLTTKSTPLGNRYIATRVDVKVLASDDVNSAVSGISNGDYVITTSSKPIESGTLVRMAEG
ncbi:MAG: HlyD family efflux transporter periplasmic adaptor subunit [Oscillospiraceae bacterium]